ncbi:MAG: HEPN domain-containing protein [Tannerellaceae bacterium]|nr:HEPN domain-containing protein [Tannerellaceae bacterium]
MITDAERNEIIQLRLENARQAVKAAEIMKENELWNSAINRMYYACYYAVTALLIKNGIEASTHAGVRQMLNLHFIKEGKLSRETGYFYSDLFAKRQSGDYDDFIMFDEKLVNTLFQELYPFIDTIKKLIEE